MFSRLLEVRSRNSWCLAEAPRLSRVLDAPRLMASVETALGRRSTGGLLRSMRRAWADRRLASLLGVDATQVEQIAQPVQQLIDAERAVRAGQAAAAPSIAAAFDAMEESSARARASFGRHLEALRSGRSRSPGASRSIALLATALRSGRAPRRRTLQDLQIDAGLEALPLWIGTLADIDDVLPMRPGMFDVVIIDESSQVNQVRAATTLARGRRAVVIGDPRQLRHVSFVGDEAMEQAAADTGVESSYPLIDVRRNSLFDVAAGRTPVLQLAEHYRSAPHLIEFSGRNFYGNQLQMMTAHPTTSRRDVIDVVQVPGRRDAAGVG